MKKILIVVDMQNDFVDGALGTAEAQAIVPKVADYIRNHADKNTVLMVTKDTHSSNYAETLEGKNLPVAHCIKNSYGWELNPAIHEAIYDTRGKYHSFDSYFPYISDHIIEKPSFGSVDLQNLLYMLDDEAGMQSGDIAEITLMGLCTGICVLSNAIMCKATLPEVPVNVVADCCACVTPASHNTAIEAMKLCQINII
jgi:nicotinamidase-related amidase